MARHSSVRVSFREIVWLSACAVLIAGAFLYGNADVREPLASAETRFVEISPSGLQIVPASCPSDPHTAGECYSQSSYYSQGSYNDGYSQSSYTGASCTLTWSPPTVVQGQTSTLYWTVAHPGTMYYPGGSFPVSQSGSGGSGGDQTKTYSFQDGSTGAWCSATLTVCPAGQVVQGNQCVPPGANSCTASFNPRAITLGGTSNFSWSAQHAGTVYYPGGSFPAGLTGSGPVGGNASGQKTYMFQDSLNGATCSDTLTTCPAGQIGQGNQCVTPQCTQPPVCSSDFKRVLNACTGATIQTCSPTSQTCIGGACITIAATLTLAPSLVRSGETTQVTWSGTNVSSCAVTEDNTSFVTPNTSAWSCNTTATCTANHENVSAGPITEQTIYTLVCTAPSGASITKTATVSVVPVWVEP